MKNECSIVQDLLPLYAEDMVRVDTAAFVQAHLEHCGACRDAYKKAKQVLPEQNAPDTAPLLTLRHKLNTKKLQTIAVTALFLIALFVSLFAVLDTPIYLPYQEKLITVEQLGDMGVCLTFDTEVTDFSYTVYDDPEGGDFYYCDVQMWTSLWDKLFKKGSGSLTATVTTRQTKPIIFVYIPNNGQENIRVASYDPNAKNRLERGVSYTGTIVLPRLSLWFYFAVAAAALLAAVIVWFFTRRKERVRIWVERIGLYPVSYLISHCIVSGLHWSTYTLPRDFSLIIFLSILLYSAALLLLNRSYAKREAERFVP